MPKGVAHPAVSSVTTAEYCHVQLRMANHVQAGLFYIVTGVQRSPSRLFSGMAGNLNQWGNIALIAEGPMPKVKVNDYGMDFQVIEMSGWGVPLRVFNYNGMPSGTSYTTYAPPIIAGNNELTIKRLSWIIETTKDLDAIDAIAQSLQDEIGNELLQSPSSLAMVPHGNEWKMMEDASSNRQFRGLCDEQARLMAMTLGQHGIGADGNRKVTASGFDLIPQAVLDAQFAPHSMTASVEDVDYITVTHPLTQERRKAFLIMEFSNAGAGHESEFPQWWEQNINQFSFQRWEGCCLVNNNWRSVWPNNTKASAFEFYRSGIWGQSGQFHFRQLFVFTQDDLPPNDVNQTVVVGYYTPYIQYQSREN